MGAPGYNAREIKHASLKNMIVLIWGRVQTEHKKGWLERDGGISCKWERVQEHMPTKSQTWMFTVALFMIVKKGYNPNLHQPVTDKMQTIHTVGMYVLQIITQMPQHGLTSKTKWKKQDKIYHIL